MTRHLTRHVLPLAVAAIATALAVALFPAHAAARLDALVVAGAATASQLQVPHRSPALPAAADPSGHGALLVLRPVGDGSALAPGAAQSPRRDGSDAVRPGPESRPSTAARALECPRAPPPCA